MQVAFSRVRAHPITSNCSTYRLGAAPGHTPTNATTKTPHGKSPLPQGILKTALPS